MNNTNFIGEELRRKREALGLSPAEVYERIHVPARHIEAIEKGDFDALPEQCYVQSFIKSYCGLLGIEALPFLDSLDECQRPPHTGFLQRATRSDSDSSWGLPLSLPPEVVTWATICAVIALSWLTYSIVFRPDAGAANGRVEAGAPNVTELEKMNGNPFDPKR